MSEVERSNRIYRLMFSRTPLGQARNGLGISATEIAELMAERLGRPYPWQRIYRLEQGRALPSVEEQRLIANILGVSMGDIDWPTRETHKTGTQA
jgi:transcriptional regulator with XRE-family HTH domain